MSVESENKYDVKKILEKRIINEKVYYLVK